MYPYTGISVSNINEKTNGSIFKSFMLSEISQTKGYILQDSIFVTFWKIQNYSDRKQICDHQSLEEGVTEMTTKVHEEPFGVMKIFSTLIAVVTDYMYLSSLIKQYVLKREISLYVNYTSINLSLKNCYREKKNYVIGTSLVVQWLRIHLLMQGTRV